MSTAPELQTQTDAEQALEVVRKPAWELENELVAALAMIEDAYDPDTGEPVDPPPFVLELVGQTARAAREKRDSLAGAIRRYEALQVVLEERARDASVKAVRVEKAVHRIKDYVLSVMGAIGETRLEGYQYKLAAVQNPDSVECDSLTQEQMRETAVPGHLRVVPEKFEWDKKAIKADLAAGVSAVPYARIKRGGTRLVIR